MTSLFNKEFFFRALSALIFIPLVMLPIIFSNYLAVVVFLLINSVIIIEINEMMLRIRSKIYFRLFKVVTVISFFLFLLMLIAFTAGQNILIEIIIIIWLFDTFSFIGGKIIGGVKLMPKISSGKTISGLIVGILSTLIITETLRAYIQINNEISFYSTLVVITFAFLGDMLASLLKRYALVKDSGKIMPGHGGLFDRFDSFIVVFFIY